MKNKLSQNLIVYQHNSLVHVRGQIDGAEIASSKSAAQAIQAAIDEVASHQGEVLLQPGRYEIENTIEMRSFVSLRGSGRGTLLVVTAPDNAGIGIQGTDLKGATIQHLAVHADKIHTQSAGIVLDNCGDCQVMDVYCQDFGEYGIWLRNQSCLCELRGCKLANNAKSNIYVDSIFRGSQVGAFPPNLVTNCIAYGGGCGFECHRALLVNFVACQAFQTANAGFYIHNHSNSVVLSGCRTFKMLNDAVRVETSHEFNATGNIFCWHRGRGIVLDNVSWATVNGNEVIDSGSECTGGMQAIGILMQGETQGVQITGNTIFNWGGQGRMTYGIKEENTCQNNGITSNNLNFFEEADILSEGKGSLVAQNVSQKDPAYQGSPESPDKRFSLEPMLAFIANTTLENTDLLKA